MRLFIYGFVAIGLGCANSAVAEVYRCEDPDQGIIFQQTPCPEPVVEEQADEAAEMVDDAAPEAAAEPPQPTRRKVSQGQDVADVIAAEQEAQRESAAVQACKQQYRDAIDAIDLEIRNSYTPEQREYYLGRLKALTDKMSAC